MFRIDDATAAGSPPSMPAAGTPGYFGNGTIVTPWWAHTTQEELLAFLTAAGVSPDKANVAQVLASAQAMFRAGLQAFTSSGNFTVPAGVTRVRAKVWGGGGGGGGASTNGAGSGGAGGGFVEELITVTPGAVIAVTVGAAGTAGPAGGASNGGPGGTSSFGGFCSATGGGGGFGGNGSIPTSSSTVGAGSGGDINLSGQPPSFGTNVGSQYFGGPGGAAPFGGTSGHSFGTNFTAAAGAFPGGGGNGSGSSSGDFAGGAGAAGLVIVEW